MVAPKPAAPPARGGSIIVQYDTSVCRSDRLKRMTDLVVGIVLFAGTLPLIGFAWIAVRLTSAGPGFYSQVRVGRNGRNYRIYKIRTMQQDCERRSGAQWCLKSDPRITPLGRILRKLHLDELPQLWNVLRGDMSLVGPRPERPEFVSPLSAEIDGYSERHLVRPGVTGLSQIQLPADTSVESVRTKLVLDRCYVADRSLWLDIRIMVGTALYLCGCSYATVGRLLWLPNPLNRDRAIENQIPMATPSSRTESILDDSVASDHDSAVYGKA